MAVGDTVFTPKARGVAFECGYALVFFSNSVNHFYFLSKLQCLICLHKPSASSAICHRRRALLLSPPSVVVLCRATESKRGKDPVHSTVYWLYSARPVYQSHAKDSLCVVDRPFHEGLSCMLYC